MANLHALPGVGARPAPPAPAPIPVEGWDCDHLGAPPVIVNSIASPEGLQAWGLGQLRQVNLLLAIIGNGQPGGLEIDAVELVGCIRHFTVQAETVLRAAHGLPIDHPGQEA